MSDISFMQRLLWIATIGWLMACEDEPRAVHDGPVDASVPLGAEQRDAALPDGQQLDAISPPPREPTAFRIALDVEEPWLGPRHKVSLDQDGGVTIFSTRACVSRPGAFVRQVDANEARALYAALRESGYFQLLDRYGGGPPGASGPCTREWSDTTQSRWRVDVDGRSKALERYHGCEGVSELAPVDALEPRLLELAGIQQSNLTDCSRMPTSYPGGSYRVSGGERTLGVLSLFPGGWRLTDCAGAPVAEGHPSWNGTSFSLVDRSERPIALPADAGVVGSLSWRTSPDDGGVRLEGVRYDDTLQLTITDASSCDD
jgi:hypothetical protein